MGILQKIFRKKPKSQLKKMAGSFRLPAFPRVAMEVRALLRDEDSTNEEIGRCLKRDAGLTLRLLQAVNSAASGRRRRIADPVAAIGLYGRANLEYMVLAHATRDAVPDPAATGYSQQEFWDIAVHRASLAEHIAREIRPSEASVSYAASLLQDIAVPVLAKAMRREYKPLLTEAGGDWSALDEYERETFGWDHSEFGGWMCEAWSFPDPITAAVTSHHRDVHEELPAPGAVRAVSFLQSLQPSIDEMDQLIQGLDDAFGISPNDTRKLVEVHFAA